MLSDTCFFRMVIGLSNAKGKMMSYPIMTRLIWDRSLRDKMDDNVRNQVVNGVECTVYEQTTMRVCRQFVVPFNRAVRRQVGLNIKAAEVMQ